ncbi:helicase-like transcription factor CHR28 [Actinidia eriantha]|uniref:helicase-like transcription factor CHR28 n=1 Tax=Actinidia eriantha TaxID=165200 RepID=UPI00258F5558|nr:helicase-like transcription factor CHR28 [Actinidia eriantha]
MLMADDRSNTCSFEDLSAGDDDMGMSIDLDSFWEILGENPGPDPLQNSLEDLSVGEVQQGLPDLERTSSFGAELRGAVTFSSSHNSEASDSWVGASDDSFESAGNYAHIDNGKQELSAQIGSPASCSGSLADWVLPGSCHGSLGGGSNGVFHTGSSYGRDHREETQYEMPNCSTTFGFAAGDASNVSDFRGALDSNQLKSETEFFQLGHLEGDGYSQYGPSNTFVGSSMMGTDTPFWDLEGGFNVQIMPNNDEIVTYIKDELEELPTQTPCLRVAMTPEAQEGKVVGAVLGAPMTDNFHVSGPHVKCEGYNLVSPTRGNSYAKTHDRTIVNKTSLQPLPRTLSNMFRKNQMACMKDERNDETVLALGMTYDGIDDSCSRKSPGDGDRFPTDKGSRQLWPPILPSNLFHAKDEKEDLFLASKRARLLLHNFDETARRDHNSIADDHCTDAKASEQPGVHPFTLMKQILFSEDDIENVLVKPESVDNPLSKISCQTIHSNVTSNSYVIDDDSDVCIIEDRSEPSESSLCSMNRKGPVIPQSCTFSDPINHMGMGGVRLKASDERLIFQAVMQDLSQPKTEASPPDGVLTVPLLRHQRIALSWMVQKEKSSLHCSGGILADDQGLGKTISTIALILKERAPSSRALPDNLKLNETETLNLDEDDDCVSVQDVESCQVLPNGSTIKRRDTSVQAKGRPAAGTLVVCPTSVLRQWAEELHNKVTSRANLSVLVYHGSNRTKDPCELTKYDVVITTYSIVSMEVPKQPLVDKDDDETERQEAHVAPPMGLSSSRKRKYPPTSKRSAKDKEGMDIESAARPLARVGWFRVVLDEAQSIKNHRTQVARACWGLRAKRRWCLSGTPIQNAVDDLYSYFRFLRYDPFAVYKSFCSMIKVPINRNSTNGYKKLQAVLKTIMLRRTKGTLLDGEPIINLPPKTVELKKVDFTSEERDFYCRLEADSRAQFAEYAAAGTVKQNYVNILLMLLRLRQACDHPFLVRGYGSGSVWKSSVDMAKKIPQEKQIYLLNCLEDSLAICGICTDPPEDAVVTSCGHVFCNQCICEHLTGDDQQCPTTNCKARLNASSVFSRVTLKCSLSERPGQVDTLDCSGSEVSDKLELSSGNHSFDSSKIKAALEVLQSLSKPRECTLGTWSLKSTADGATCRENSADSLSRGVEEGDMLNRNSDTFKGSNNVIKVAGEKAIVFSQWTRMLDLLETCLKNSSIQYRRLDGTMTVLARDKAVKDFNTLPEVSVMIMSLKAASLGLNMVAACHVLLLDLWWNPTTEDQAIDRAHRIGQTRPVTVLRLTVKDTVEDRILALQQKKREMVASAFGEDESGSCQTRLTVEDLKYLFSV